MAGLACTIVVEGELDGRFHETFDGLTVSVTGGRSELSGFVTDQAELQGVLRQLFDLGLTVVSFTTDAAADHPWDIANHPGD
jgi:hypothetical protein